MPRYVRFLGQSPALNNQTIATATTTTTNKDTVDTDHVNLEFRKLRQKGYEFKAKRDDIENSRPDWTIWDLVSK